MQNNSLIVYCHTSGLNDTDDLVSIAIGVLPYCSYKLSGVYYAKVYLPSGNYNTKFTGVTSADEDILVKNNVKQVATNVVRFIYENIDYKQPILLVGRGVEFHRRHLEKLLKEVDIEFDFNTSHIDINNLLHISGRNDYSKQLKQLGIVEPISAKDHVKVMSILLKNMFVENNECS